MDTVCLTSTSTDSWCQKNCVVQCQDGRGAGSGFVREREAAETCHYPQRGGGGNEATLKYEGCISTNEWTDNKVTFKRGGRLLFSTRLNHAADLETEGWKGGWRTKPDSFQQHHSALLQQAESGYSWCIIPLRCNMRGLRCRFMPAAIRL